MGSEPMLEMDGKMGFFAWAYYPQERHTLENIKKFHHNLYLRSVFYPLEIVEDETSVFARERRDFLSGKIMNVDFPFILTESGEVNPARWSGPFDLMNKEHRRKADQVNYESYFEFCAGLPGSLESYPKYQRPGCISVCHFTHKECYNPANPWQHKAVFYVLKEFATIFDVVYAFGHFQYNRWVRTYETMPPPERRIWPFNIFNLRLYDKVLLGRLSDFNKADPAWALDVVDDHIAFFHLKDLATPEAKVPPSVTETLLGSGDKILLPRGQTGI